MSEAHEFDQGVIVKQLSGLTPRHAAAFAAVCCERMLPNYQRFVEAERWGNMTVLRQALDAVWRYVGGEAVPEGQLQALKTECVAVIPDPDDFPTLLVSHALDASASICETLVLCLDGDVSRAASVASSARDTVDMHIQERDQMKYGAPDFEEHIVRDPLMIREIDNQRADLASIATRKHLDPYFVQSLRAKYEGRSNLM